MRLPRPLLATLACGALLAGACGGDDGDDADGGGGDGGGGEKAACPVDVLDEAAAGGPVEITFWHSMGGAEPARALQEIADEYNASQDRVRVELLNQQSYESNFEAYRTATPEDRPDLVQLPDYYVQALVDSGTVVPIQACLDAAGFDTDPLLDPAVAYYTLQGELQAMPFNVSNPVLYYNKAMFEAAGLDPESPPRTLEELREAARAIVESGAAAYGIALETGFASGGGWAIEQWFASVGELYADNDNGRAGRATEVLFDNDLGVEIFTFLQDLVEDGLAVNVGENAQGTDGLFKLADATEPAAMTLYTSAAISSVLNVLAGGDVPGFTADMLGIGPLPVPEGGTGVTVGGAALWIVEDQPPEHRAAAWDFITYLVSPEVQSRWAVATGYVPVHEAAVDTPPWSETVAADARFRVAYDQLLASPGDPAHSGPVLGPMRQVRGELASALQRVLSGGADPAEALGQAAEAANQLLEDYALRTGTG